MTGSRRSVAASLAVLGSLFCCGSVAQARTTTVGPGQSIQTAVDTARPGDTIRVYGTHRENVVVQTDRLKLQGVGAVIEPPATPAVHACFDPTEENEAVHGICVFGDVDFETGVVTRYVDGVHVSGFTIRRFVGSGLVAVAARNTAFDGNALRDNTDSGANIGNSVATHVRANQVSGSRFGILMSGADGGDIVANSLRNNCSGAVLLGADVDIALVANDIADNRRACAADAEVPPLSGIGVGLVGATDTEIVANRIVRNTPTGETAFSGGVVVVEGSAGSVVKGNIVLGNDPDIVWDETGSSNVFAHNLCRTSTPPGLCG